MPSVEGARLGIDIDDVLAIDLRGQLWNGLDGLQEILGVQSLLSRAAVSIVGYRYTWYLNTILHDVVIAVAGCQGCSGEKQY